MIEMGLFEAALMAKKSYDPSTQCGVSIWQKDGFPAAKGFNGPVVVEHDTAYGSDRETKYKHIEHAERTAIYYAARHGKKLEGATMFATWVACPECAKAIILSGISKVVSFQRTHDAMSCRWRDTVYEGLGLLEQAGVEVVLWDGELSDIGDNLYIRFNGEYLKL